MALDVNSRGEALRVGAHLRVCKNNGSLTDALITATAVAQIERLTVVGTVGAGGAGNLALNVRVPQWLSAALWNGGAGKAISVAVANNDSASDVAGKIRTALNGDADYTAVFENAAGSAANVDCALKGRYDTIDINISYGLGTSTGLTAVPASTTQTAGVGINGLAAAINLTGQAIKAGTVFQAQTTKAAAMAASLRLGNLAGPATVEGLIAQTGYTGPSRSFYD